ncbi:MAG TPA: hypothetical protein VKG02_25990, partial [Blastocatellia bacterium]|nr:hypothetical protein [Blastocatellia bacterium]
MAAGVALGVSALAGCNETAKAHAAVRQPAPTPAPTSARPMGNSMAQATPVAPVPKVEQIPLPANPPQTTNLMTADRRTSVDILAEQVQAAYDAGRKDAAAGNEDKAQAEYNRALDLMLKSGYPVDKDPKLSKLFDEIGDVVQADDKTAPEAETTDTTKDVEEADVPSQPAPIDSIEDLTLPAGDPRLAAFARREVISVKHDLPLTVNESVLQYLSYFTTTKGRAIVEHGLTREGQYDPMIRRVLREEGVPEDLIYLAQAESAFLPDALS